MKIVVLGLGYVGLPLAVALARKFEVLGFDIEASRVSELQAGFDRTREIEREELTTSSLAVTGDMDSCHGADVYVVTVPTPVDSNNQPDLAAVLSASQLVGTFIDPSTGEERCRVTASVEGTVLNPMVSWPLVAPGQWLLATGSPVATHRLE